MQILSNLRELNMQKCGEILFKIARWPYKQQSQICKTAEFRIVERVMGIKSQLVGAARERIRNVPDAFGINWKFIKQFIITELYRRAPSRSYHIFDKPSLMLKSIRAAAFIFNAKYIEFFKSQ